VDAVLKDFPEVARTYATVKSGTSANGVRQATIQVTMVPQDERDLRPQGHDRARCARRWPWCRESR
jgi:hypothetical protein